MVAQQVGSLSDQVSRNMKGKTSDRDKMVVMKGWSLYWVVVKWASTAPPEENNSSATFVVV